MYHQLDNLYFGRTKDGSVRILKVASIPEEFPRIDDEFPDAVLDVVPRRTL